MDMDNREFARSPAPMNNRLSSSNGPPNSDSSWDIRYLEATKSGFTSSLDDYIELYRYTKAVLARQWSVSPSRIKGFDVVPLHDSSLTSSSSLFSVTPVPRSILHKRSLAQSSFPRPSPTTRSSTEWLQAIHRRIETEFSKIPSTPLYERHRAREEELDLELRARRVAKVTKKELEFPRLTEEMHQLIHCALSKADEEVVASKFGIDFCGKDLLTLRSPRWLNDEVINFYMQMIEERSQKSDNNLPSVHVFSTFFYPKLKDRGYDAVRTSTRRVKPSPLSRDLIFIPIHLGMHWCMAAIDFKKRTISYYDSLHGTNKQCLSVLGSWLRAESKDKLGVDFDSTGWTESCPKNIPAQQNGYDCGVFALIFADCLSRNVPFNFSQSHMTYFRDRLSYEILSESFI